MRAAKRMYPMGLLASFTGIGGIKYGVVGPFKERKRIMTGICEKAGVRYFRYHALRHFGASLLEQANIPIGSIQRILGHENRATTEIYLHSIGDSERLASQVLNVCLGDFSRTDSHTEKKGLQA